MWMGGGLGGGSECRVWGDLGLGMRNDARCLSGQKFGKAGWSLWMAVNSRMRTLGLILRCLGGAGPLEGLSDGRIGRV